MKEKDVKRSRRVTFRLTPQEFEATQKKYKKSTCRDLSDYVRHLVLSKPIITTFRDRSLDDFMAEMSLLRTELNRIGNNFNQSVKRLHTLQQMAEFKTWTVTYELEKRTLANKLDEIKEHLKLFAEKWLQK